MRTFKIACVIFLTLNLYGFIEGLDAFRSSAPARTVVTYHSALGTVVLQTSPYEQVLGLIASLVGALIFASALYGIHKRMPLTWKLGWVALATEFALVEVEMMSSIVKMPKTDYPWVAFALVLIGGLLGAGYWGQWWNRQKSYFAPRHDEAA